MQVHTLSFRADDALATETRALVGQVGLKSSGYIRGTIREKDEHMMVERTAALSHKLLARHLTESQAIEGSAANGGVPSFSV